MCSKRIYQPVICLTLFTTCRYYLIFNLKIFWYLYARVCVCVSVSHRILLQNSVVVLHVLCDSFWTDTVAEVTECFEF